VKHTIQPIARTKTNWIMWKLILKLVVATIIEECVNATVKKGGENVLAEIVPLNSLDNNWRSTVFSLQVFWYNCRNGFNSKHCENGWSCDIEV